MHGQAHDWCANANGSARRTGRADKASAGGCIAGVAATLSPGCYTSIATSVTTLNPGIYYVTGKLDVATNLTGTGVMIYLTGGGYISIGNNNELHLSAPTSGHLHRDCDLSGSKRQQ